MERWVKRRSQVVLAREAKLSDQPDCLFRHGPDTIDDRLWVRARMGQRPFQVVHDRQPLSRDPDPLLLSRITQIPVVTLAGVVQFSKRAQPLVR